MGEKLSERFGEKFMYVPGIFKEQDKDVLGTRTEWVDKSKEWLYVSGELHDSFQHDLRILYACGKYISELKIVAASES